MATWPTPGPSRGATRVFMCSHSTGSISATVVSRFVQQRKGVTMVDAELAVAQAYEAEAVLEQALSRREMRRLGVTVLNVRRRAKQLAIAGEITSDMPHEQICNIILDDLQGGE